MGYRVAVVAATGTVGQEMLEVLGRRKFPADEVYAIASKQSAGLKLPFAQGELTVYDLATFDFGKVDIVLSSPGAKVSADYVPRATAQGAIVIDNTSYFRMDPDVPLVVPEVNPEAIAGYDKRRIIANPNCSTIQMLVALAPLHRVVPIKRIVVATYQSVSGAGKAAMDALLQQTRVALLSEDSPLYLDARQFAFNVVPQIDVFMGDGSTKEEWKMAVETQKILDPNIQVQATCARVPVLIGHSEAITVEFSEHITVREAKKILREAQGVIVVENNGCVTPVQCVGTDFVYVSRIRQDPTVPHGLSFWCVADNLRKGAALNAVQIAEELVLRKYI